MTSAPHQPTHRPSVGLLFNPSTPEVMAQHADLVEHLSVNPGEMFNDLGPHSRFGQRFAFPASLLRAVASAASPGWPSTSTCSSHPAAPKPTAKAHGPAGELRRLRRRSGLRLLLENPALLTPLEKMEMDEPTFLNTLHQHGHCGVLLDLHNLLVSERNGGLPMEHYLARLNPAAVEEVHLADGEELFGVYSDSHSQLTPEAVWAMAHAFLPCYPNLRAIRFEYNETYFEFIGCQGVRAELERMHRLAESCALAPAPQGAPC